MLEEDTSRTGFDKVAYVKNFKERQNVSKLVLDSDAGCKYLNPGEACEVKYDEFRGVSYVACTSLSFDAALSVYDANSGAIFVARLVDFAPTLQLAIQKWARPLKNPNLETRLIGLQSGQRDVVPPVLRFLKKSKLPLVEADLFGSESRNVAFDVKTGVSFDVLVSNRPYKPGELASKTTLEQFERSTTAQQPPKQTKTSSKTKYPKPK